MDTLENIEARLSQRSGPTADQQNQDQSTGHAQGYPEAVTVFRETTKCRV